MPESYIGWRDIDAPSIPDEVETRYVDNVAALLDMCPQTAEDEQTEPYQLTLSDEARALFTDFQKLIEPMLREGAELREIRDWASKFAGAVARIAALLHFATLTGDLPFCNTVVSARTFQAAITIGEYLVNHARAVLFRSGCDGAASDAEQIVKWIQREGLSTFTKHDANRSLQAHFAKAEYMDPALSLLVVNNYLREEGSESQKKRGRGRPKSTAYLVNPLLNEMTQMSKCTYEPILINCSKSSNGGDETERKSWTPARVAQDSEDCAVTAR